ncbi:fibronectin type III domain-containing protein [Candidatus Woesearchaeota archaeon]|nr:fibronectin type III domain-containing protein [Candidatus Woesearchaeota archaeon]
MKTKTFDIKRMFSIFVIAVMMLIPVETCFAMNLRDITVSDVSDRYAIINWQTDNAGDSSVVFGQDESSLSVKSSSVMTENHSVMLSPLIPGTDYIFNVSSRNGTDFAISTADTFTTLTSDNAPPFIGVELPEYAGSTTIPMTVYTEPNSQVYIYVNDTLQEYDNSSMSDGTAYFNSVRLISSSAKITPNIVRFVAIDPSGNRNEITKTVNVDTSPPDITFDSQVPTAIKTQSLTVSGNSDEPAKMNIYVDRILSTSVDIESPWTATINFPEQKRYSLEFIAVDRAGNEFSLAQSILVDTTDFFFEPIGAYSTIDDVVRGLSPAYIATQTIRGKTNKADATVVLLLNDFDGTKLNEIEGDLSKAVATGDPSRFPTTLFELLGINQASGTLTTSSFTTNKPVVYVTKTDENGYFTQKIELTKQFSLTSKEAESIGYSEGDTWKNTVQIFAVDLVGNSRKSAQIPVYMSRCGGPGYFEISSPVPQPASIPEPMLKAGAGQFGLDFDIKWNGPSAKEDVTIIRAEILAQEISEEDRRGRYNLTMNRDNPLFNQGAVQKFPEVPDKETNKWFAFITLNKFTGDFTNPTKESAYTPELEFPLKIQIEYSYKLPNGQSSGRQVQYKCVNLKIDVDLEATDYLNEAGVNKFLDKTIAFLDNRINDIDDIMKVTTPLQEYAVYGCAIGLGLSFLNNLIFTQGFACRGRNLKQDLINGDINIEYKNGKAECKEVEGKTTTQMMSCCRATLRSMSFANKIDYICDRIFCPSVPTLTKHKLTYSDPIVKSPSATTTQKATPGEVGDFSGLGNAKTQCVSSNYGEPGSKTDCESEFQRAWGAILPFDWPASEYKMAYNYNSGATTKSKSLTSAASDFQKAASTLTDFTTNICASEPNSEPRIYSYGQSRDGIPVAYRVYKNEVPASVSSDLVDVTMLVDFGQYAELKVYEEKGKGNVQTVEVEGSNKRFLSMTSKGYLDFDYQTGCCKDPECNKFVGLGNMGFSSKCNGEWAKLPDEVIAYARTGYSKDYVFNPAGGIISSVRSMCLPAVNGYLSTYKNLMTAVRNCFAAVREGEKLNAGSCQQIMSEVVCDFVIDAMSCAWNTLGNLAQHTSGGKGKDLGTSFNPFSMVKNAGDSVSEHITTRYGDTSAFRSLFDEQKLVHSLCIGAFTGDWDVEMLNDIFTEAGKTPINPVCVATPSQRRFITANPIDGKPSYVYYVGGMLAAGSGVDSFSIQLVCSVTNDCLRYGTESNPNGACDCAGRSQEEIIQIPTTVQSLGDGEVYDEPPIYYTVQDSDYRYDKLRISYTYKDNTGKQVTDSCEANLAERGNVLPTCKWYTGLGFRCEAKLGDRGLARFTKQPSVPIINSVEKTFVGGEELYFDGGVEVMNPSSGADIPKYIRYVITNDHGSVVYDQTDRLDPGFTNVLKLKGEKETGDLYYKIDPKDFGTFATTTPLPSITPRNGVTFVTGSSSQSTDASAFLVTFPDVANPSKYQCMKIGTDSSGSEVVFERGTLNPGGTYPSISCGGVQFRVEGIVKPAAFPTSTSDMKLSDFESKYVGTYIIVKPGSQASSTQDACDSTERTWHATFTLYHSQLGSEAASSNIVYADGKAQTTTETPLGFKVMCKAQGLTTEGTAQAELIAFDIEPKTAKKTDKITVKYRIYSQEYESLELKVNNVPIKLTVPIGKNGIQVEEEQVVDLSELSSLDAGEKDVILVLNGKNSPNTIKLTITG